MAELLDHDPGAPWLGVNPDHPDFTHPARDSGDHLHLNEAGYQAMAEAIDRRLLENAGRRRRIAFWHRSIKPLCQDYRGFLALLSPNRAVAFRSQAAVERPFGFAPIIVVLPTFGCTPKQTLGAVATIVNFRGKGRCRLAACLVSELSLTPGPATGPTRGRSGMRSSAIVAERPSGCVDTAAMPSQLNADRPWVVVRIDCVLCTRKGCYRLARLAARYGPEQSVDEILRDLCHL